MMARIAALAFALVATGCAMAPPAPQGLPELSGIPPAFEISARLALRVGDRSEIARLRWTHRPGSDLWVIASPIGPEVARIESGPAGAVLSQGADEPRHAPSFAALTESLLGVALEPALLARWLHGADIAEAPSGWSVRIEESQRAGSVELARLLVATRGDASLRLVVDDYRVVEP